MNIRYSLQFYLHDQIALRKNSIARFLQPSMVNYENQYIIALRSRRENLNN